MRLNMNLNKPHKYTRKIFFDLTMRGLHNSLNYSRKRAMETFKETNDAELLKDSMDLIEHLERTLKDL